MREARLTLAGWGRLTRGESAVMRPERLAELRAGLGAPPPRGVIAHGAARAYGDCALNTEGRALLTGRLDRILAFDEATGVIEVEPGVTFARLLTHFLPRGWMVPVTPGTGHATIGGAVANDVHGKNHEHAGSFGQHVSAFDLLMADGAIRTLRPGDDLFRATAGGIGLTGIITRIAFRMVRVAGGRIAVRERRCTDLDAFLAAMEEAAAAPFSVGWIDGLARGARLGRGILEVADTFSGRLDLWPRKARAVPVDFPGLALNPLSIAAFNELYFRRVPEAGRERRVPVAEFFYPLDAISGWNRIYGKRGFAQFQCVVPHETGPAALRDMLETIAAARQASFLAVLKRMGPGRAGYLSFPMPGYTLALDFPRRRGLEELYARLARRARDAGGRVYLAKDALLSRDDFTAMYPELPDFRAALAVADPGGLFSSDMARRLGLRA